MNRIAKFNWNQSGMPTTLVSGLVRKNEFVAIKTMLNDAGSRVMRAVDAEAMARELMACDNRELLDMVRDLTTSLAQAEKDLEAANRRYEQLTENLARRGIKITENLPPLRKPRKSGSKSNAAFSSNESDSPGNPEWEEWNRKFQSLLG